MVETFQLAIGDTTRRSIKFSEKVTDKFFEVEKGHYGDVNSDGRNGVDAFDLVLISKHILGVQLLNSPYKMIAADINKSNSVTTFDMVELRKLILYINESFTSNTSWRFVDKAYVFPNPLNPWAEVFPEVININNLMAPISGLDFIAIKIGDVNNSADPTSFTSPNGVEDRALAEKPIMATVPKSLKAGEVLTLPFWYDNDMALSAFQMGVGFDENALSFIGAAKGDLERLYGDNFGLTETDKGHVRMLWFSPDEVRWMAKKGQTLFHLSFEAKQDIADVGAAFWLDDAILPNRGYDRQGNESRLVLNMLQQHDDAPGDGQPMSAKFYPNPFSGPPAIEVSSETATTATLWLFNAFGVRVAYQEVALVEGTNTFTLDAASGLPKGVYIWKVKTQGFKTSGIAVKQ